VIFSAQCWNKLGINWNHQCNRIEAIIQAKDNFQGGLFLEIFIIAAWGYGKSAIILSSNVLGQQELRGEVESL
jgi:hypothetical protein